MPGSILLGLSGIGGGIISNALNNQNNLAITQQTNATNMAINEAQIAYAQQAAEDADTRTRNLFNDLYSPNARVQQLKDAGLSVGLMYGQSGIGGSGAAGAQANTPSMIPAQSTQMSPLLSAELAAMLANTAKTQAETENINAKTQTEKANLPLIEQTTELVKQQTKNAETESVKMLQEIDNMVAQKSLILEQQKDTKAAAELKQAQKEFQETQNAISKIDLSYEDELKFWQVAEMEEQYEKLFQEARKIGVEADKMQEYIEGQIKLMAAQALQAKANEAKSDKERELINEQIRTIQRSNDIEKELDDIFDGPEDKKGVGGAVRRFGKTCWKIYQDYKRSQQQPYSR